MPTYFPRWGGKAIKAEADYALMLDAELLNLNLSMQGDYLIDHHDPSMPLYRSDPGLNIRSALSHRTAKTINYLSTDMDYVESRYLELGNHLVLQLSIYFDMRPPIETWIELAPVLSKVVATGTRWKPRKQISV